MRILEHFTLKTITWLTSLILLIYCIYVYCTFTGCMDYHAQEKHTQITMNQSDIAAMNIANSAEVTQNFEFELNKKNNQLNNKKGQVDQIFPQQNPSNRALVNNRVIFKGYQGRGHIIIYNENAAFATITVNGEKIKLPSPMQANKQYHLQLNKLSRNGNNTLKVEKILPEGKHIKIVIPYPELETATQPYQQDFKEVDRFIKEEVKHGFPGAVLVVVKNGTIVKNTAYGYARIYATGGKILNYTKPMTVNTLFDIASNTKMFATNLAIMKLVSEGKLDINLPIQHYLSQYHGEGRELRTVKDLLSHNAGYAPQIKFYTKDNLLGSDFYSQNKERTKHLLLTKVPFVTDRLTQQVYSDIDFMLLGMLVEKISRMPLDLYTEHTIYKPLNLTDTVFNPLQKQFKKNQIAATEIHGTTRGHRIYFDNVRTGVIQGEVHDENAYHSLAGVAGHAGLFSTGQDLAVLAQTLLNKGGYGHKFFFSEKVIDQFIKSDDVNDNFGLGWRRENYGKNKWLFGPYASSAAFGHTGWTGTAIVIDPKHDLAIMLLTNARHSRIEGNNQNVTFNGKQFETAKYGSIMSLVYEAILTH